MNIFRRPFVVTRFNPGSYVNGAWAEGTSSQITISASVQPVAGIDLELLPEGRRTSMSVKIYTDVALQTATSTTNPDVLHAFGHEFEITSVMPWQSNVISHYKCIGVKKG